MAKIESRVQTRNRRFPSTIRVEPLIRALNSDLGGKMKGNRKIVDARALLVLVKRFQALDEILKDRNVPLFSRGSRGEIIDSPEVLRRFGAVNRFLRRYTAKPVILPEYMSDLNPNSRGWLFEWSRAGAHEQPFAELGMVLQIKDLAEEGRISSIKQCAHCRRWLFARFPHQRFCQESCKEMFHRTDEADKKRRRDWAKQNYWIHKNKNAK